MPGRIKVLDVELTAPPDPLGNIEEYKALWALVRLHGYPVGHVEVKLLPETAWTSADLRRVILRRLAWPIVRHHLLNLIAVPLPVQRLGFEELLETPHRQVDFQHADSAPSVTVAVCTRDRTEDLKRCLDALVRLDYPNLDILVVDNAPSSDATERLVENSFRRVRYAREPRPGLDWARNRAIREARGQIIAYTDDDTVVDPRWVRAMAAVFQDPQVMVVTGLTVPYELETEAQVLFERYGGFGRGYRRRYWRIHDTTTKQLAAHLGGGQYGAGANMAFRRSVFEEVGYFDPALDVGTVTTGGGDIDMFFRIVRSGHTLVYEPGALVRHRHRRDYASLRKQLADNSVGLYSYLVRTAVADPDARPAVAKFGAWWYWRWNMRRLLTSLVRPPHVPRDLMLVESWYSLVGLKRYLSARRTARRIAGSYPEGSPELSPSVPRMPQCEANTGVRTIELGRPLRALEDVTSYAALRAFVTKHGELMGFADITNHRRPVSAHEMSDAIVDQLRLGLLRREWHGLWSASWADERAALERHYLHTAEHSSAAIRSSNTLNVSIVVPTYDRPCELRECLSSLTAQATARSFEIIVVDNHPVSGVTSSVVAEFPDVVLVDEERQGRAYASNRGFAAARGEIIASIDDDMTAPPDWLEKLVAPFVHPDVAAVTGNTLPRKLETPAQRVFEEFGGFYRGVVAWEADGDWFYAFRRQAVPTWRLGGSGNVAFRTNLLSLPEVGPMDEMLGAGTPTGTGEDIYFFYRVLRAGYTIAYAPSAYAWHNHRPEMRVLRDQIYSYHKGHVAYHLMTLLRDRDKRAVWQLGLRLPRERLRQLGSYAKRRFLGRSYYPLDLFLVEVGGNLAGPWALWRSYRRVREASRTYRHHPTSQHGSSAEKVRPH